MSVLIFSVLLHRKRFDKVVMAKVMRCIPSIFLPETEEVDPTKPKVDRPTLASTVEKIAMDERKSVLYDNIIENAPVYRLPEPKDGDPGGDPPKWTKCEVGHEYDFDTWSIKVDNNFLIRATPYFTSKRTRPSD
jgi:hypothetical protein